MGDPLNLTGRWDGVFRYPQDIMPVTPFLAEISESAGVFSGTVIEPDINGSGSASAKLDGHREGQSIDFTKVYTMREAGYENPVDYVGQIAPDGLSITGMWSLLDMNGSFEMHRDAAAEVLAEQEEALAEPLEVPLDIPQSLEGS
ncbi:MAG: hypothetical protein ABJP48_07415 [Erythrobacter sp.]